MNQALKQKLANLPSSPGVYFHKDKNGQIIYIGKAAVLKNRVRQYFQSTALRDPKTAVLVSEIADTDWQEVTSEIEALFLEAELVRRYLPKFNILLRDDKSLIYIRIDINSDYPTVSTTRRPLDDGAKYFGPYLSSQNVRVALKYLRRVFPYATSRSIGQKRASLNYYIGLDPGLESGKTSLADYRANLRRLISYIKGNQTKLVVEIEIAMKNAAKFQSYELAVNLRNQLLALKNLNKQIVFGHSEQIDISKDHALSQLTELLGLATEPNQIEGFDISHHSGSDVVASMVVFVYGVSQKQKYRKFKIKVDKNDDYENMRQTISRRLSSKNIKLWGTPDLMLVDGGKGQLSAALAARDHAELKHIPVIGLAKKFEQIVLATPDADSSKPSSNVNLNSQLVYSLGGYLTKSKDFIVLNLPQNSHVIKLLQRIRDESHRFAISYHSVLKTKRQNKSLLDDIPTIGPATSKKLIKIFGSARGVTQASDREIQKVVGDKKAKIISQYLNVKK